jgi:predicted TIM-barrel fold metal-dependent hydrolase
MSTTLTYPTDGWGAPKNRRPVPPNDLELPVGTEVFSADNHISLSEDIFVERAPASMKDRVPQVINVEGGWAVGLGGQSILHPQFLEVLTQYDPLPGSHAGDVDARLGALDSEGVDKELAFPNAILALFGFPDKEVREVCFRIYNEYIADVQERSGHRIYGVGLINWWDADGARRTLEEAKSFGLTTVLMPLNPGKDGNKVPIDYASQAMDDVWSVIEESGLPVSHHIGETPAATPNQFNAVAISMLQSVAPFRDTFGKYVFGGILDRHPGLQIGFFEGGINWVPSVLQDAEHLAASFHHLNDLVPAHDPRWYWEHHMMSSFMLDPLGLHLLDRIGVDRVMWSTDFPHNESTYGYSNESLATVVRAVGADDAAKIVSHNVKRYLGLD